MKMCYIDEKPITFDTKIFNHGEEGNLYRYENNQLVKIFKDNRRPTLPKIDEELYALICTLDLKRHYFPRRLVYYASGKFAGYTLYNFPNPEVASHAQKADVSRIIEELKLIEQDIKTLSDSNIQVGDMKLPHILYNPVDIQLGIIDCGLYEKVKESLDPNAQKRKLYKQNLIEMNYYLRQALLWADYEGTRHEMVGYDFPEIYDELDEGSMLLSDILKEETQKYGTGTLEELKHCYQKMKFY